MEVPRAPDNRVPQLDVALIIFLPYYYANIYNKLRGSFPVV